MRNKFLYSCSIKICASGFHELVESIFCFLLVVEAFSLEKVVKMLEVVVNWQEVRWTWWMRQNFIANSLNFWSVGCAICSQALLWRRIGPFLWPVLAAALQFLVYLINWLNILLRCNGFTRILKAVVHQTGKEIRKESEVSRSCLTLWSHGL